MSKTAIVFGATGLTGNEIVKSLCNDEYYNKVIIFSRRSSGFKYDKITKHNVDFENFSSFKDLIKGDVIFSAMGTTKKKSKK